MTYRSKLWFILYVFSGEASEFISYALKNLTIELSDPRHPTVLSTGYNVDLTM